MVSDTYACGTARAVHNRSQRAAIMTSCGTVWYTHNHRHEQCQVGTRACMGSLGHEERCYTAAHCILCMSSWMCCAVCSNGSLPGLHPPHPKPGQTQCLWHAHHQDHQLHPGLSPSLPWPSPDPVLTLSAHADTFVVPAQDHVLASSQVLELALGLFRDP